MFKKIRTLTKQRKQRQEAARRLKDIQWFESELERIRREVEGAK